MPQYIRIAIVANNKERLEVIKTILGLPEEGIYPRYYFVTPKDDIDKLVNPKNYSFGHIHLWISLDAISHKFCQKKHSENLKDVNFNRGFYNQLLPNPVINIEDEKNTVEVLKKYTEEILKAFCETS